MTIAQVAPSRATQGNLTFGPDAPLVAIATPVYNGARFLAETMASVQAQTYPNIVHIVLDNASTDETPQIIDGFRGGKFPLITARNNSTLQQTANWNAALRMIPKEARYFRTLPADDLMMPDFVAKLVSLGERHPEVSVIGCREYANEMLRHSDLPAYEAVIGGAAMVRASLRYKIVGFPHIHSLCRVPPGGVPDPFYVERFYDTPLECFDTEGNMRLLANSYFGWVPEPLVMNREHEGTVTTNRLNSTGLKLWGDLQHLDMWGPTVFETAKGYKACRRELLRFYYRHMLVWRLRRNRENIDRNRDLLARANALPSLGEYVMSVVEWPFLRAARYLNPLFVKIGLLSPLYKLR